jgi:hypothetical protein
LFASSAIGFLVSQIWFALFHYERKYARLLEEQDVEYYIAEASNWKPIGKDGYKSDKDRDAFMATIVDYVLNEFLKDKTFGFFQRKIDLYHIMSCTSVSLIIGLCLGLVFRGLAIRFWSGYGFDWRIDYVLFFSTLVSAMLFVGILVCLTKKIFVEYHPMLKLLLRNLTPENKKLLRESLAQVFPQYFDSKKTTETSPK